MTRNVRGILKAHRRIREARLLGRPKLEAYCAHADQNVEAASAVFDWHCGGGVVRNDVRELII